MLKIGITGNIGSGKTTICKLFELLDIPVFYADEQAKLIMTTDAELVAGLIKSFGAEAYLPDGTLNRKYIAGIVFNNDAALQKLNALVHPAVLRAFNKWAVLHTQAPYVVKEAALLFESGSYHDCDYTLLVTAPTAIRLQRVANRDHITLEQAQSRNSKQMPEKEKAKLADFIIANDNSQLVIPQVLALHQRFLKESQPAQ